MRTRTRAAPPWAPLLSAAGCVATSPSRRHLVPLHEHSGTLSCTGYLGDIGVVPDPEPMDFSAWFEAYLGGRWYTFDARYNKPRIGRIVIARGRDAADVAFSTTFGPNTLKQFSVITDEMVGEPVQLEERKVA